MLGEENTLYMNLIHRQEPTDGQPFCHSAYSEKMTSFMYMEEVLRDDRGCGGGNRTEVCPDKGIIIATHYCSYERRILLVATIFTSSGHWL